MSVLYLFIALKVNGQEYRCIFMIFVVLFVASKNIITISMPVKTLP